MNESFFMINIALMAIPDRNKSEVKKLSTYLEKEAITSKSFSHRTTLIVGSSVLGNINMLLYADNESIIV